MPVVLVGDFNIDLLTNSSPRHSFHEAIETFHCTNVIQSPTRITLEKDSLIDVCVTNHELPNVLSGVIIIDLSDHLPIFCFFPPDNKKTEKTTSSAHSTYIEFLTKKILLSLDR